MKRTHFFHGILLIVLILSFMACKDDHGPIYLVSATDHQQITDGKLEISPFSKGEKFLIRGGDGNYTIKNEKKEVVDYRYDGDTLTFIPVSIGETSTLIADRSGNSYTLTIVVNNPQNNYRVESISAEVEGNDLTKGEETELLARIAEDAPVQSGGRLLFTYSDASLTLGDLKIFPGNTGNYQIGIFKRTLKYTEDTGEPYLQFQVEMAGSTTNYTFMLFENETSSTQTADNTSSTNEEGAATTNCFIKEEVTAQYKGEFSGLTKAYRIYHLTKQP
ncbi:hypothetical protein [Phocaeicola plebeius]|uniref:hypothetical protein n=1 Tax=Phocaeicola plebeius TaxID=310297 RepID=UPI003F9D9324